MHQNIGFVFEKEFIAALDGKMAKDLSHNLKHTLKEMFGSFKEEDIVHCESVRNFQKADVVIDFNGQKKYVSLKTGSASGVGELRLKNFILYLRNHGFDEEVQKIVLLFQFGDGTLDGTGKKRYDDIKLKYLLQNKIKKLNAELNKSKDFVKEFIHYMLFKGPEEDYVEVDYIYFGTMDYGVICSEKQIVKHIDRRNWGYINNPHIGPIHFRPHARYANSEIKKEESRWRVDFYWPNLGREIAFIGQRYDG